MRAEDQLGFAWQALAGHRLRSGLMLLAMAIGVAAVVFLTALGDGARRFVVGEFSSLGTHLLIVLPGRNETTGGAPPILGETPRDLTLADAAALERHHRVRRIAPIIVGGVLASHGSREREITVVGTTPDYLAIRGLGLAQGRNLPADSAERARAVCLIGRKVQRELFGPEPALGQWLRVADRRCRITGILAAEGRSLGLDMEEVLLLPVATTEQLFNTNSLFRILVEARSREDIAPAKEAVARIIRERHEGEDDVTVITQDALVATFDRILTALTYMVGGVAAISLVVAGILIMNVMLVAVSQRTREIGLLKALGTPPRRIVGLFLTEAALLSLMGAVLGLAMGAGLAAGLSAVYPALPVRPPLWSITAAVTVAVTTGLIFGLLPARRAARLDPVQALAGR